MNVSKPVFVTAVANAFAILSDTTKKKHYDLYGPEDAAHHSRGGRGGHFEHNRPYEGEITCILIFIFMLTFHILLPITMRV